MTLESLLVAGSLDGRLATERADVVGAAVASATAKVVRCAQKDAVNARRRYLNDNLYPVDMIGVVHNASIKVMVAAIVDPGFAGYYDGATDTIYVNAASAPDRLRVTLAQEFGHWYDLKVSRWRAGCDRPVRSAYMSPEDVYAGEFAACFLMPGRLVRKLRSHGATVNNLAGNFGVPEDSVMHRLNSLGLID